MFSYHLKIIKYCQERLENYSGAKFTYFCLVSLIVLCTEISFSVNPIAVKNEVLSVIPGVNYQPESTIAKGMAVLFHQNILKVDGECKNYCFVEPREQIKLFAALKSYLNIIKEEAKGAFAQLFAEISAIMPAGPPVGQIGISAPCQEKLNRPLCLISSFPISNPNREFLFVRR